MLWETLGDNQMKTHSNPGIPGVSQTAMYKAWTLACFNEKASRYLTVPLTGPQNSRVSGCDPFIGERSENHLS